MTVDPQSPEFRALFRVNPNTEQIKAHDVNQLALAVMGDEYSPHIALLVVLTQSEEYPDYEQIILGLHLELARNLHRALEETLDQIDSYQAPGK